MDGLFSFMWLKDRSLSLNPRLLETGYLNVMEKPSAGDGFLRPKEFHRGTQGKQPRQHRVKMLTHSCGSSVTRQSSPSLQRCQAGTKRSKGTWG